jgi:hypothetical protein
MTLKPDAETERRGLDPSHASGQRFEVRHFLCFPSYCYCGIDIQEIGEVKGKDTRWKTSHLKELIDYGRVGYEPESNL